MRSNYVAYADLMQAGQDLVEAVYPWDVGTRLALARVLLAAERAMEPDADQYDRSAARTVIERLLDALPPYEWRDHPEPGVCVRVAHMGQHANGQPRPSGTRKRGGGSARPLTAAELGQIEAGKALLKGALEARWPLRHTWGDSAWSVTRSRSQDGQTLRINVAWSDGPTEAEVIKLAESLDWPVGVPITLSLRRRPIHGSSLRPCGAMALSPPRTAW